MIVFDWRCFEICSLVLFWSRVLYVYQIVSKADAWKKVMPIKTYRHENCPTKSLHSEEVVMWSDTKVSTAGLSWSIFSQFPYPRSTLRYFGYDTSMLDLRSIPYMSSFIALHWWNIPSKHHCRWFWCRQCLPRLRKKFVQLFRARRLCRSHSTGCTIEPMFLSTTFDHHCRQWHVFRLNTCVGFLLRKHVGMIETINSWNNLVSNVKYICIIGLTANQWEVYILCILSSLET